MADFFQPGQHPDVDQLNAFMEKALPEHERLTTLAHLATCVECRNVIFLAQKDQLPESPAVAQQDSLPWWRAWRSPALVAGVTFACLCVLVVSVTVQQLAKDHNKPVPAVQRAPAAATDSHTTAGPEEPQNEVESKLEPPAAQPKAAPPPPVARQTPQGTVPKPPEARPPAGVGGVMGGILGGIGTAPDAPSAQPQAAAAPAPPAIAVIKPQGAPTPSAAPSASRGMFAGSFALTQASPAAGGPLRLNIEHGRAIANGLSELQGTVRDPTGAAIPKATVTVRGLSGQANATATSDEAGGFSLGSLPAGPYEIQVASTGFAPLTQRVDLEAKDLARIDPVLPVGSASQTVEIVAADALQKESPSARKKSREDTFVSQTELRGTLLAFDSAGTLFRKAPGEENWKKVKPRWHGVVTGLSVDPATTSFLVTSSAGDTWVSEDGRNWKRH